MKNIELILKGEGHDQLLNLLYDEVLVFWGVADDLITSINGELQMRLNFSEKKGFLHTLKRFGEFALLIPDINSVDVKEYIMLSPGRVLVWSVNDLISLWNKMRYDPSELEEIKLATNDDLFLTWLISSRCSSVSSLDGSTMPREIMANILAEEPDGKPSTKDIIAQLAMDEIQLGEVNFGKIENFVTAYMAETDNSVIEWKSLSSGRNCCLIGDYFFMRIVRH